MSDNLKTDAREDDEDGNATGGRGQGGGITLAAKRKDLLDHSDEEPKGYEQKKIDLRLLDDVTDIIVNRLDGEKFLTSNVKREAIEILGAIQGIGKKGEDFHNKTEQEQNGLLADMRYSGSLAEINEKFMVGMEYKPPMPVVGPAGPAFVPMGPGLGGGGGMRPMAPQPTPPGGMPPQFPTYQQPPYGQPQYPQAGYPTYPPQPYPPVEGQPPYDPYAAQQYGQGYGQGYAQPHPYPSYPVPPQQGGYPYPPQHPGQQQPYPPHGAPPHWPPPQPGYPPHPGYPPQPQHAQWPPQQPPVVMDAETTDAAPEPATSDDKTE